MTSKPLIVAEAMGRVLNPRAGFISLGFGIAKIHRKWQSQRQHVRHRGDVGCKAIHSRPQYSYNHPADGISTQVHRIGQLMLKTPEALFSLLGGLIAAVAAAAALIASFHEEKPKLLNPHTVSMDVSTIQDLSKSVEHVTKEQNNTYKAVDDRISKLETEFNDVDNKLKYVERLPVDSKIAKIAIAIQGLKTNTENTRIRVDKLENALLATPSKALEVPLLRQELDDIKTAQRVDSEHIKELLSEDLDRLSESVGEARKSLSESVDRVYDFNKWLLGGLCVGIMSLAIGNLLKAAEKPVGEKKVAG
jgi:hypothetical protein